MAKTQTIRLVKPDGSEELIEIPAKLYARFAKAAKELGVSEEELFHRAMNWFLEKEGYGNYSTNRKG